MSASDTPREPRTFAPDDHMLSVERAAEPIVEITQKVPAAWSISATPTAVGNRGVRWGALLLSAVAGAAILGIGTWLASYISAALAREDWVGTLTFACLLIAAFAGCMILLREISGFARLARLARLKQDVATALSRKDRQAERNAALRLVELYRGRPDLSWGISRFREHVNDISDPGELLGLAEREIVVPLDQQARAVVTSSAKRVATVTALSPIAPISVAYVLIENVSLLRALAVLYGGRPGTLGALKLSRLVLTHLIATGGIAMTDDLLGQFLGQDFLRRLSRRLGEGAINGALTARIGVAAVEVIRPLPFMTSHPPRMRDIVAEAMKPLISRAKPEVATQSK
jgi:putative membrane protein